MRIVKVLKITLFVLFVLLVLGFSFLFYPRTDIITGYAAKALCSCTFISNREKADIVDNDLGFSPISLAKSTINLAEKSVTSTVLGIGKRTAYYHKGYGCVLDNDNIKSNNKIDYTLPNYANHIDSLHLKWPYGPIVEDSTFSTINYDQLNKTIASVFDKDKDEPLLKTRSMLVVYKDQIITEQYATGFDKDSPMLGWSITKSILNALFGILVKEKGYDINLAAPIDAWKNDNRSKITTNHLLQMNSGLSWDEDYSKISDVTKMLFQAEDVSSVQLNKKSEFDPLTHWNYSSGTSNLLSKILKDQFASQSAYLSYPYQKLFGPLGMKSMVMETDMSGNFIGSSYSFATTRDWAKFGLLYLHDGVWNGQRILPEGWVNYSITPTPTSNKEYGSQIWLNAGGKYKDAPLDMYSFNGFQGQRIFIIPSKELVIVRTAIHSLSTDEYNELLKEIVNCLKLDK